MGTYETFAPLQKGCAFSGTVMVVRGEGATDKHGDEFLRFTFSDSDANQIKARYYRFMPAQRTAYLNTEWADVEGRCDFFQEPYLQVTSLQPCGEPRNADEYLPCSPIPRDTLVDELFALVNSIREPHLLALLRCVFENPAVTEPFFKWPAAQENHHAFRRGLLHHTVEVARYVALLADEHRRWCQQPLNRDLAVAGALLHDVGKIRELEEDGLAFTYSVSGNLLGHVLLGVEKVRYCIAAVRKKHAFPRELEMELVHLIAAHHGKGEWGAIKEPSTPEAILVSQADYLSTQLFYAMEKTAGDNGGAFAWHRKIGANGGRIFTDRQPIYEDAVAEETLPLPTWIPTLPSFRAADLPILPFLTDTRARQMSENNFAVRSLVVLGRSAAGVPLLDSDEEDGERVVDLSALGNEAEGRFYLLQIDGDSMTGDAIEDGEWVVVRHQRTTEPHEIAIVMVDGGATAKRIHHDEERVWLVPSNKKHKPQLVADPAALQIQGRVVAIAR